MSKGSQLTSVSDNYGRSHISRPLLCAGLFDEVELADWIAIERSLVSFNYRVMAVNSHRGMITRDRESKDILVKFLFALYRSIKYRGA